MTKVKPRKPPWNKGLKKSKASAKDETRNSAIIAAVEERAVEVRHTAPVGVTYSPSFLLRTLSTYHVLFLFHPGD